MCIPDTFTVSIRVVCPQCGSHRLRQVNGAVRVPTQAVAVLECPDCGYSWSLTWLLRRLSVPEAPRREARIDRERSVA